MVQYNIESTAVSSNIFSESIRKTTKNLGIRLTTFGKFCRNLGQTLSWTDFQSYPQLPAKLYTAYPQPANPCAGCCFHTTPMEYLTNPCGYCLTILWFFRYNPTIVSDDGYYIISLSYSIITIISLYYDYIISIRISISGT